MELHFDINRFWPVMFAKAATHLAHGLDGVHSAKGGPQPEGDVHGPV